MRRSLSFFFLLVPVVSFFLLDTNPALAAVASSTNYQLEFDSLNFVGGHSTSANYTLEDTGGEAGTGYSSTSNQTIHAGYQQSQTSESNPPPVLGCTNPRALNFNALATVDDGSCRFDQGGGESCLILNANNFQAVYNTLAGRVNLSWTNPAAAVGVRIVRQTNTYPNTQNDGVLIYQGSGTSAADSNIAAGATYFYALFAQAAAGCWSSGTVAGVAIPGQSSSPPAPVPPSPPPSSPPSPPSCTDPDCFSFPPCPAGEKCGGVQTILEIIIKQPGEPDKIFRNGETVHIVGEKPLTFWLPVARVPAGLKTIVVTLTSPDDETLTFAFLLRLNDEKTAYTATVGALRRGGYYPAKIHALSYDNYALERLQGRLLISSVAFLPINPPPLVPAVIFTTLALSRLWPLIMTVSQTASLYELWLFLLNLLNSFLSFVGLRKKRPGWGVVYDAVTKRPLDPAVVTVLKETGEEATTAITDLDGRYGLLLPPGIYMLKASKTHYRFPSTLLIGRSRDEVYDNLYFGDKLETRPGQPIALNIPLDPIGFDWNEYIKNRANYFRFYSERELKIRRAVNTVFYLGFLLAIANLVWLPSFSTLGVVLVYVIILAYSWWREWRYRLVRVKRSTTGEPVPYALIRVAFADLGQEVKTVITDNLGRFYLLVQPGVYTLTVEEKLPDGRYQKIGQWGPENLPTGLLTHDLLV